MLCWAACNFIEVAESEPETERPGSLEVTRSSERRESSGLTRRISPATLEKLPGNGWRSKFSPREVWTCCGFGWSGVWVLFENSTVCFVCDSAKFFVWLRPFHIPVVGVAFLETASFGFVSLLGLCFS